MPTKPATNARPAQTITWHSDPVPLPSVEELCDWLGSRPALDDVANEARRLRVLLKDADVAVRLLRQYVLLAMGDDPDAVRAGINPNRYVVDDEPF